MTLVEASKVRDGKSTKRLLGVVVVVAVLALSPLAGRAVASTSSRPTKVEIQAQTRATVQASDARLLFLRVESNRLYQLRVQVNDPAAYLKHRVNRVADPISRLSLRNKSFTVVDRAGNPVFWIKLVSKPGESGYTWYVRPNLTACIDNIAFGIESNPDGTAPACPAR